MNLDGEPLAPQTVTPPVDSQPLAPQTVTPPVDSQPLAPSQLKIKAVATVDCGSIMCCDIGAIRHRHG